MHSVLVRGVPLQLNHVHSCGWRKGKRIVVVEEGRRRRGRGGNMGSYQPGALKVKYYMDQAVVFTRLDQSL